MSNEILKIVLTAFGVLISGLATWLTTKLTSFLNRKIKDKDAARFMTEITDMVMRCVTTVTQTYVSDLKKEGSFTKEKQEIAFNKSLDLIKSQLSTEVKDYIQENYGDLTSYLKSQIETIIYQSKDSK